MIISASRRTDIPAFYSQWLMNRIMAGYCAVPNPFNYKTISRISLSPEDVKIIVFWTRNPKPLFKNLNFLHRAGFNYYFNYTLMDYPKPFDPMLINLSHKLDTFKKLSDTIGPEKVVWRYDPIILSNLTPVEMHLKVYEKIAQSLRGYTYRSIISFVDLYKKVKNRFRSELKEDIRIDTVHEKPIETYTLLLGQLAQIAHDNTIEIYTCSEPLDFTPYGIKPGKCIDSNYIKKFFGIEVDDRKDPHQRKFCGCVKSKDIGMYDTCLFGCKYCYATHSLTKAKKNYKTHDPDSPSLIGWYDA